MLSGVAALAGLVGTCVFGSMVQAVVRGHTYATLVFMVASVLVAPVFALAAHLHLTRRVRAGLVMFVIPTVLVVATGVAIVAREAVAARDQRRARSAEEATLLPSDHAELERHARDGSISWRHPTIGFSLTTPSDAIDLELAPEARARLPGRGQQVWAWTRPNSREVMTLVLGATRGVHEDGARDVAINLVAGAQGVSHETVSPVISVLGPAHFATQVQAPVRGETAVFVVHVFCSARTRRGYTLMAMTLSPSAFVPGLRRIRADACRSAGDLEPQ